MSSHSGGMGTASSQEDCVRKYDARNSISSGHAKQLRLSYYFKVRYNGPNKRYFLRLLAAKFLPTRTIGIVILVFACFRSTGYIKAKPPFHPLESPLSDSKGKNACSDVMNIIT